MVGPFAIHTTQESTLTLRYDDVSMEIVDAVASGLGAGVVTTARVITNGTTLWTVVADHDGTFVAPAGIVLPNELLGVKVVQSLEYE